MGTPVPGVPIFCVDGAVCGVNLKSNKIKTIGNKPPVGICGTGIIELISELLNMNIIDSTGFLHGKSFKLTENIMFNQNDIRQIQTAKAAVRAGIDILMSLFGTDSEGISNVYLAGDIGTGAREIGYMFGQYKKIKDVYEGVLTGKGLTWGGSLTRTEATGYGLVYYAAEMLKDLGTDFNGKTVAISGAGNVAIYACQKVQQLGGKVITVSDSNGYVIDEEGIDLAAVHLPERF